MRVLIAEDQALLRERLADLLGEEGCDVAFQAVDGRQAADWLREHPGAVDGLFLDIEMPGLRGLEVAASFPHLPAVFVTAFQDYAAAAWDQAAVDYLLKPVTPGRIAAALARLRRRLAGAAPAAECV